MYSNVMHERQAHCNSGHEGVRELTCNLFSNSAFIFTASAAGSLDFWTAEETHYLNNMTGYIQH